MPAKLDVGFNFYGEFAPADDAVDQSTISARDLTLSVSGRTFKRVVRVFETSELEPDVREFKYYAPGVGLLVAEEDLDRNFANPELRFEPSL